MLELAWGDLWGLGEFALVLLSELAWMKGSQMVMAMQWVGFEDFVLIVDCKR